MRVWVKTYTIYILGFWKSRLLSNFNIKRVKKAITAFNDKLKIDL